MHNLVDSCFETTAEVSDFVIKLLITYNSYHAALSVYSNFGIMFSNRIFVRFLGCS
jgi:hypothetical protein